MTDPQIHTRNKRALVLIPAFAGLLGACTPRGPVAEPPADGVYRGVFIDRDRIEVGVELRLENGAVTSASFRHLGYGDAFRLDNPEDPYRAVIQQYREALAHLVEKDLATHLPDLYHPERIITTEVDGFTQATVRANKIISAVRDALNRGVYSHE